MQIVRRLASFLALVLVVSGLSSCGSGGGMTVTAQFRDSAGLFVGNDVGVLGVKVGTVTKIDPEGSLVSVTLRLDSGVKIPASAGAVIVSRSVATDRYVEMTPVYAQGPTMADGATIALAKTRNPVEFDDVLSTVDDLTSTIAGPDKTSSAFSDVISVLAQTLDGNGTRIAKTTKNLDSALGAINGGSDDVAAVLGNLDSLTKTLADNDKTVRDFSDNVSQAVTMFNSEHVLLRQTFDALALMLKQVAAFSKDHRAQIGGQLDDVTALTRSLLDHQSQLSENLETMPLLLQNIQKAVDEDGRLTFRVRPGDLIPGADSAGELCDEIPAGLCDQLDLQHSSFFDILNLLTGVKK